MEHDSEMLSLATLGQGACIERFDDELQRVLQNLMDPNTTLAARSITLKVTMKPDDKRQVCVTAVDCSSKLAAVKPFGTTVFVGRDSKTGVVIAAEHNPDQMKLFPEGEEKEKKVYHLGGQKDGEK